MSDQLLLTDIPWLVTVDPARATAEDPLGVIRDAAVLIADGLVRWVGPNHEAVPVGTGGSTRAVGRGVVLPGFVDCHTHLVFAGNRAGEFARKLAGVPYMQIAAEGGGILATMRAVRQASPEELVRRGLQELAHSLSWGVTTMEVKSGYGLETRAELKQLAAVAELDRRQPIELLATFMGAHEFPPEYRDRREAFVDVLVNEMLPAVVEQGIARYCDVFCEQGVFDLAQTRRILLKAKELGLIPRLHADEFVDLGGAALAAELGAASADHLLAANPESRRAMREAGVVAVLLPGVPFFLNQPWPNGRAMVDEGLTVAVASDFNPGSSMSQNLLLMAQIASCRMRLTIPEAIRAITLNAARALRIDDRVGSIAPGRQADLLLADLDQPEELIYHFGINPFRWVMKRGALVWERST